MAQENSVLNSMITHHALIEVYLTVLKDSLNGPMQDVETAFYNFRWQLEKHFFVEERAIFGEYKMENSTIKQIIERILLEHRQMIQMMDELKTKIENKEEADFSQLSKMVISHRELEDKELYPLVDRELSSKEKENIVKKINDIVLEGG